MRDLNKIITTLSKNSKVLPAFNVPYLPMVEPVIQAVVDKNSFALIETARLEWLKFAAGSAQEVAREYDRWKNLSHVRLHLDHIPVIDEDGQLVDYLKLIREAIDLGFDSVMIDGSRLSLKENMMVTKKVTNLAHQAGIPCEAELGAVMGHESGPLLPYDEIFASGKGFTNIEEARQFVDQTECDWLSVAIGNIHGAISDGLKDQKKIAARLDLDHLEKLSIATHIPLVLHGGSGIPKSLVLASFSKGIAKINIGTEIRQAYEVEIKASNNIAQAQKAVYDRTCWLISDYFAIENTSDLLSPEEK
jgi:ketose-bisphosphate aldolase